jgi:cation diffusion facilitator family transporter
MEIKNENKNRNDVGKRAGLIGILTNVFLATAKLFAGIISSSMSIIADAINNFSDGISSVVTMIGFKLAQKPADADHPYGHARFEYVASLFVSILVLFVGFELGKSSLQKIFSPEPIVFSILSVVILSISIIVKLALSIYNYKMAKLINSDALRATAIDSRNDAIVTFFVLIATIVERFSSLQVDGYMGLLVAIFILYSGVNLVKETISPILGSKNNEQTKKIILDKLKDYPVVIGYHDLMIHDYGPGTCFCSIHFEIDKNHDPLYVHELIDKFERECFALGINLTVHYDPVVTDSEELNLLKHTVISALVNLNNDLSIHDFRIIPCDGFTKVFFDLPLPDCLCDKKQLLTATVNDAMNGLCIGRYQAEITFDSIDFN